MEPTNLSVDYEKVIGGKRLPSVFIRDPLFYSIYSSSKILDSEISSDRYCKICFENVTDPEIWNCDCDSSYAEVPNYFCVGCIKRFIKGEVEISNLTSDGFIKCPCLDCEKKIFRKDLELLFTTDEEKGIIDRFDVFQKNKVIDSDPLSRWCPKPGCGHSVKIPHASIMRVTCEKCLTTFCTICSVQHSIFVSCSLVADYGFQAYRLKTAQGCKRCPKCKLYIEKNEGCNHMTCSRCHQQFCWLCLSKWNGRCSSLKSYCQFQQLLSSKMWGDTAFKRVTTKTLAVPATVIVGGVGAAVGAAALGVSVAVGAAGVGVVGCAAVISSPFVLGHYLHRHLRISRNGLKWKTTMPDNFEFQLQETLLKGVRIICPWSHTDAIYLAHLQDSNYSRFMGYPGRFVDGMFIAYPNAFQVEGTRDVFPAILFFVPMSVSIAVQETLMRNPIVVVTLPLFVPPAGIHNLRITDAMISRRVLDEESNRYRPGLITDGALITLLGRRQHLPPFVATSSNEETGTEFLTRLSVICQNPIPNIEPDLQLHSVQCELMGIRDVHRRSLGATQTIQSLLAQGIQMRCPLTLSNSDFVSSVHRTAENDKFLGYSGRFVDDVFIAYVNQFHLEEREYYYSVIVFVPTDMEPAQSNMHCTDGMIRLEMPYSLLEGHSEEFTIRENTDSFIMKTLRDMLLHQSESLKVEVDPDTGMNLISMRSEGREINVKKLDDMLLRRSLICLSRDAFQEMEQDNLLEENSHTSGILVD